MKELSIEQKAALYDEAIKKVNDYYEGKTKLYSDVDKTLDYLFPELKESEDERIRGAIIDHLKDNNLTEWADWLEKQGDKDSQIKLPTFTFNDVLALQCCMETVKKVQEDKELYGQLQSLHNRLYDTYQIEKQGEIDKTSYEIAEKEKREFVGDGFIKCYADFQDFKEGETYWLEYQGDDKYNVRSDNLLGKTYHITPCQLYTVFKKQTWLEKQGECHISHDDEILIKQLTEYFTTGHGLQNTNKTVVEWLNNVKEKLEKQGEQHPKFKIGDTIKKSISDIVTISEIDLKNREYRLSNTGFIPFKYEHLWELVEQKPADKTEPKFKVEKDKWYVCTSQYCNLIEGRAYKAPLDARIIDDYGTEYDMHDDAYRWFRPWTIQDAKPGDVLVASDGSIFLFKGAIDCACKHYVALTADGAVKFNEGLEHFWETSTAVHPSTKEQRDLLFQKMHEAGYEWDAEHKQLKKIESESAWSEEDEKLYKSALWHIKNSCGNGGKNSGEFEVYNWLKSLKDRVQPKQEWSEEDEDAIGMAIIALDDMYDEDAPNTTYGGYNLPFNKAAERLKSLRPQNMWKPSDEQMDVLVWCKPLFVDPKLKGILESLIDDLKKLREEDV